MEVLGKDIELMRVGHSINLAGVIYTDDQQKTMKVLLLPGEVDSSLAIEPAQELSLQEWDRFFEQSDLLLAQGLAEDQNGKQTKIIVRKSQRQVAQEVMWACYRRDGYACRYCGNNKTPLTTDHLVLWEDGGPSTEQNMLTACKKCNRTRGNLKYDAWLAHPFYAKVSQNLAPAVREANAAILPTLGSIKTNPHQRSKRS